MSLSIYTDAFKIEATNYYNKKEPIMCQLVGLHVLIHWLFIVPLTNVFFNKHL